MSEQGFDAAAVRRAFEEFERPLLGYAARLTGDAETARDVVQEVFLRLVREGAQLNGRMPQWLFAVCRNLAIDAKRKGGRMTTMTALSPAMEARLACPAPQEPVELPITVQSPAAAEPRIREGEAPAEPRTRKDEPSAEPLNAVGVTRSLSARASATDMNVNLLALLETLPDNQQEVIRLRLGANLSYKQIADVTGHSVSNVGFLMHAGIKKLREQVGA